RTQADEHVVRQADDRHHATPEVEADPHVEQNPDERREHGVQRLLAQLASDLWPDRFEPQDLWLATRALLERAGDAPAQLGRSALAQVSADQDVALISEALDDAVAQCDLGQTRADGGDRGRLGQPDFHERAAGEVDVVPQTALDEYR